MQWRVENDVFDALCDIRCTTKFPRSSHLPSKKTTVTVTVIVYVGGYRVKSKT